MDYNEKELLEKFPFIRLVNAFTGEEIPNATFLSCVPNGWISVFVAYCEEVLPVYNSWDNETKKKFYFTDVKEKYGTLRIYTSFYSDEMQKATWLAEARSEVTCIDCGKQSKNSRGEHISYMTKGYILPYCKECAKKQFYSTKRIKEHFTKEKVKNNKVYITTVSSSGKVTKGYDLGEW